MSMQVYCLIGEAILRHMIPSRRRDQQYSDKISASLCAGYSKAGRAEVSVRRDHWLCEGSGSEPICVAVVGTLH